MSPGYMKSAFKAVFSFTWGPVSLEKNNLQKTNKQTSKKQRTSKKKNNSKTNEPPKYCYHDKNCKPVQTRSIPTPAEAAIWLLVEQCMCTKMYMNCPYSKGLDAVCQEFNILAHTFPKQMQQVNGKETFFIMYNVPMITRWLVLCMYPKIIDYEKKKSITIWTHNNHQGIHTV